MDQKIKLLTEKLRDERGKKVVFVSHCILNENTRYLGGAFRKGCIDEIVDEVQNQGIGMVQLKCPEQKAWGGVLKKHVWQGLDSKNTMLYRLRKALLRIFVWNTKRIYRKIAKEVITEIKDYIDSGFEVVGIIGIGGSPTCGVNKILDFEALEWLAGMDIDDLERKSMNEWLYKKFLIKGRGLFIEALAKELRKKNIAVRFYEHDLVSEMAGKKTKIEFKKT